MNPKRKSAKFQYSECTRKMETDTLIAVTPMERPMCQFSESQQDMLMTNLPQDWKVLRHTNGLPFWVHEPSGVITWTKPYIRNFNLEVRRLLYNNEISRLT